MSEYPEERLCDEESEKDNAESVIRPSQLGTKTNAQLSLWSSPLMIVAKVPSLVLRDAEDGRDNDQRSRKELNRSVPREPAARTTKTREKNSGRNEEYGSDTSDCGYTQRVCVSFMNARAKGENSAHHARSEPYLGGSNLRLKLFRSQLFRAG
jgi:hypothetical protein